MLRMILGISWELLACEMVLWEALHGRAQQGRPRQSYLFMLLKEVWTNSKEGSGISCIKHSMLKASVISAFLKPFLQDVEVDINSEEVNEEAEDHESDHAIMRYLGYLYFTITCFSFIQSLMI